MKKFQYHFCIGKSYYVSSVSSKNDLKYSKLLNDSNYGYSGTGLRIIKTL